MDIDADALIETMAEGDAVIRDAAKQALLRGTLTGYDSAVTERILQGQAIVKDAIAHEKAFAALYHTLCAGIAKYAEARRLSQPGYARFAPMVERIRAAASMLGILLALVTDVKKQFSGFSSEGMREYARAFSSFYDDAFLKAARAKQKDAAALSDGSCVRIGAKFGNGLKCADMHIRAIEPYRKLRRLKGIRGISIATANLQSKAIALRDAALANILHLISTVNAQMTASLTRLQCEIGFYLGCARLYRALNALGVPLCFPAPCGPESGRLRFDELIDAGLALRVKEKPVGNTLSLDQKELIVITGANQGGKSTFIRSIGLAQAMMQCGIFVCAQSFEASAVNGLYAHFCRAEDGGMDSGKLDEELRRMDTIVERITPNSMLLMNESFSSTTERDGAAIAREITLTLTAIGVRVLYVTHLYDFAKSAENLKTPSVELLRADRDGQGGRSFHIRPGIAMPTSHGLDLYERILGK